jgi:DNA-binding CsgD family transcriptional regulator
MTSAALVQIRQLCCLELPQETFIPEFLRSLGDAVASEYIGAAFLDDHGAVQRVYTNHPVLDQAGRQYASRYANSDEEKLAWAYGTIAQTVRAGLIENAWHVDASMVRSNFYNEAVRPFGIRHQLRAAFRTKMGLGGALYLTRGQSDKHFIRHDEQTLASVLPYLSHAANTAQTIRGEMVAIGESGLIILDRHGVIEYLDQSAKATLSIAAQRAFELPVSIHQLLARIAADLNKIASGQDASIPQRQYRNTCGEFVLRGRLLTEFDHSTKQLVAVTIQRYVPVALKAVDALRKAPLSARQKQICVGIVKGMSFVDLAVALGLRPGTLSDYTRIVYEKLEVQSREQLRGVLLG